MRPELAQFANEVRELVPAGTELLDVHTHLGADEDGHALDLPTLLRQLDQVGVARACVFPLHDPDRRPAYRVPNDRILEWTSQTDGRLIPFCRLDPADDPVAEAERCLARGARGIKLHPRAQTFGFDDGKSDGIFRLAEEARVPVLIHAGRGMPPIAEGLCDLALRHPGTPLILAHGGIADQAVFARRLADHPAAFYDSSVFGPLDLLELYARVPAERIIFGSDPPYGRPLLGLYVTVRAATAAGVDADGMRALLGGTAEAILNGGELPEPMPPLRPRTLRLAGPLMRMYVYASMAFAGFMRGELEGARETLDLALSVCRDPDPGTAEGALRRIEPALEAVRRALDTPGDRIPHDVLYLAMALAATEPEPAR